MSTKSLIKSTGIIGVATAVSRILGFIRDILIARFFGTTVVAEAFFIAFRIPNLLRHLVAEGAANSAFVPVLSEYLTKNKPREYWRLVNILFTVVLIALMALVVIGVITAPLIVRIIAPGFAKDPEAMKLTVTLSRVMFPYILLVGLAAYAMAILNSLKHFSIPAFAPALVNVAIISTILIFYRNVTIMKLAFAVLAGGALQLLINVPLLYKMGMRLRLTLPPYGARERHPAVDKLAALLLPRIMSSGIYHLNVLVDTMLASFYWIVGAGGIAALWFSNRLIQLPTAVFGISLATASLPALSHCAAQNDMEGFKGMMGFSLKAVLLVMIPATAGITVLAGPIVKTLFQRGEFTAYSTAITSAALFFYAFGLFSYSGAKMLVHAFYSMQDTVTPLKIAAASLLVNILLNILLMFPLKIGGLALATSVSGIFNFALLFRALKKRIGPLGGERVTVFSLKVTAAAAAMGLLLYLGLGRLNAFITGKGFLQCAAALFFYIILGMAAYALMLCSLRIKEVGRFAGWILRKR